jgi:heme/copper-type cytochrome/quinol oxidase subunit 3
MKKQVNPQLDTKSPPFPWISRFSYLMDEQFRFPGTKFRFGLDPILNLFPFVGDMAGLLISGGLLMAMAKKGASNKLVVLMSANILLDATVGAIPVIGQIFEFFFKANTRNIRLMKEHYLENKHQGSGKNVIYLIVAIVIVVIALMIFGLWKLAELIF